MAFWLNQISPQINAVWRGEWKRGHIEPVRALFDHELVIVTRGSCTVTMKNRSQEFKAGDFFIIPPDCFHTTTCSEPVHRCCIHFDWSAAPGRKPHPVCCYYPKRPKKTTIVPTPAFVPEENFTGSLSLEGPIPALIETFFHRWQTGERIQQALARANFLELLVYLMRPRADKHRASDRHTQLAHAVKDLMDQQGESPKGIQALLGGLGFSYPHLCRLFGKTFGVTPVEYRNAVRLERAKALLGNPRLSIADVAYAVGFQDPGYFTRQFRKQNGVSPKAFR